MKTFWALCAAAALLWIGLPNATRISAAEDAVVAKGKGFEVRESEVEEAFIAYKANLAARGQTIPESQRQTVESSLAERIALTKLLVARSTDADKAKAAELAEKIVGDAKKRFPNETMFRQQLRAAGTSPEEFERRVQEQSICETVLEREVRSKITVSDEAVKQFYDENPARFEQPEKVRASHILLSTQEGAGRAPVSESAKKAKREKIEELKKRAEAGEDFAQLAREFSEDPGSKETGGEYTFARGQMVKPFETAAFSLEPGKISDVVETQYGYHIIKLHEKLPARKLELAEVTDQIRERLIAEQYEKQVPGFLDNVKKEAGFEIVSPAK